MPDDKLLTPEQFFEARNFAGEYIRKEDFLEFTKHMFTKKQVGDAFDAGFFICSMYPERLEAGRRQFFKIFHKTQP